MIFEEFQNFSAFLDFDKVEQANQFESTYLIREWSEKEPRMEESSLP